MLKRMKIYSVFLVLVFMLQSILMPMAYAEEAANVVMEISMPQLSLASCGNTANSVELVWTSTDNSVKAASYDIYRNDSVIKNTTSFTYTDVELTPQTKYTYLVKAKDADGKIIAESNALSVTTLSEAAVSSAVSEKLTGPAIDLGQPEVLEAGGILKHGAADFKTDRFIVKYKNENGKKSARKAFEKMDAKKNIFDKEFKKLLKESKQDKGKYVTDTLSSENLTDNKDNNDNGSIDVVPLNEGQTLKEFTAVLEKNDVAGNIEYIQPDYQFSLASYDPYYSHQWGLENNTKDTKSTSHLTMPERLEMLPPHLRNAVDSNTELKDFLVNTPVGEIHEKMMSGDVPGNAEPQMLMEIANKLSLINIVDTTSGQETGQHSYLCDTGISESWEKSTGNGVTVAVIDTGIDTAHEDLSENIWVNGKEIPGNGIDDDGNGKIDDINGWNFSDNSNILCDNTNLAGESHGTHLAGIISAVKDNQKGIAGVAPSAKVMPLKVFKDGKAYTSDVINAIQYAESMGVKIVNCSWGSTDENPALKEAIQNSGMLFVCAAGNSSSDIDSNPVYPAAFDCPNIITVASINQNGSLSSFSNFGQNNVDVAAPGEGIYSTLTGNTYGEKSGTSMAAAFVSGEAALLLSYSSKLDTKGLKERIIKCSDHLSSLNGRINQCSKINCINSIKDIASEEVINVPEAITTQNVSTLENSASHISLFSTTAVEGQFVKIAAGDEHSLALKSDGTVWACGYNYYGQLGDGTIIYRALPVKVSGLSGITTIAGGQNHSLALKNDGTVWAWGNNSSGQLGDGTKTDRTTPVQVSGLSKITAIASGRGHSFALKSDGTVWSWGDNSFGQLGDGTIISRSTAVQVTGLDGITAIECGYAHSLALKNDGTVWAWGNNSSGQLGDGTTTARTVAVKVSGLNGITAVVGGGGHSLALKNDGTVWAWGSNDSGQLGDGTTIERTSAVKVIGLNGIKVIAGGVSHSMALKNDRTVWTWGSNDRGQLGDGTTTARTMASQVSGLIGAIAIAGGDRHSLALKNDGTVWAWGNEYYGQLGDGKSLMSITAVQVSGLSGITVVAAGENHSLALKNDGTVWAWGFNYYGQLGDGTTTTRVTPVQVKGLSGITAIAGGSGHSLALKNDGTVWAWGFNYYGQLGDGTTTTRTTPVQVSGLSGIIAISAGNYHSLALKNDGTVWSWGANYAYQLGDTTAISKSTAVQVYMSYDINAISAGGDHNLALMNDGRVLGWGANGYGQMGNGTTTLSDRPEILSGLYMIRGITDVKGGELHSLLLDSTGTVGAWGYNNLGQLGNGTEGEQFSTVQVIKYVYYYLTDIIAISAGDYHNLALKNDGTVWSWGYNGYGQLGTEDYTAGTRTEADQVSGLSGVTGIAAGGNHSLALKGDGTVWAWGDSGKLGNGEKGFAEHANYSFGTPNTSNYQPTLTIFSPLENQVFFKTISVNGTINDQNIGDVLTLKYSIDAGAEQTSQTTYTSDGIYNTFSIENIDISTLVDGSHRISMRVVDGKGSASGTQTITFTKVSGLSVTKTITCISGNTFNLTLKLKDIKSISGKTFTITYNQSDKTAVTDLCKMTYQKETADPANSTDAAYTILGTGITIKENKPGIIVFTVNKDILTGKIWSGVVNIIEFKPAVSGEITLTCKVE